MRRIAFTRLSHLTRPPDAAEAFSAGSGPLGLFVQPAPSRSPPRLALFLHVTLRTSSQLASFCAFAPRPASPRPHPPRRSRELGSFCIIDSGIPAGPPPIGFVCTTSHRPLWHKLGLFGASRPSDSSAGSSAGRVPPGGIGFVLPRPVDCTINHDSFAAKPLPIPTAWRELALFPEAGHRGDVARSAALPDWLCLYN
jgi:hypothetical protein